MRLRSWLIVPCCALGFLLLADRGRLQRVRYVSGLAEPAASGAASAPEVFNDRAGGQRNLLVPERNENSFAWIAQTQQMLTQGEWRVRHVDYENAPFGREVDAPSPYRWWLGLVAWLDHLVSGRPAGASVERAALVADPLLHVLLVVGGTAFVAWRFGIFAAALFSIGLVAVFPLAAAFLPGAPDSRGLSAVGALGSVLLLLAGMRAVAPGPAGARDVRRWFALAGVVGGLGTWIDVSTQVPVLAGIFLGGLLAAWAGRLPSSVTPAGEPILPPWCAWGCGGGLTILASYLAEYFPAHLGTWRLESIHPIYGLAWMGGSELLARAAAWSGGKRPVRNVRDVVRVVLAAAAIAAVPCVMGKTGDPGFLARDLLWARLTSLPEGPVAASFQTWVARDGFSPAVWATLLPLVLVLPAGWLLVRRSTAPALRTPLALALGPVVVAGGFAWRQLSWWSVLDGLLLVLLVTATARSSSAPATRTRWAWAALVGVFALPGVTQLWPRPAAGPGLTLTGLETEELVERHLAHWLARQAGEAGVVVFAPPHQTTTLCFYGGLRGIGTFAVGNRAGFGTTLAIAGAATMEEAELLVRGRGVRYLVLPSWDPFFDDFARLYLERSFSNRTSFLVRELRRWNLPLWLRPMPYQMPVSGGFAGQRALVFEVVDEQNPVVAASRLAEYLVEIGELDQAAAAGEALRRFPGDVGALAARAQVQIARQDTAGATETIDTVVSRLSVGADRYLPWDRRVSLAMVLARGQRIELARAQVKRCLADLDESRLRSLTTGSLYGLQVLTGVFKLQIADPRLRALALDLLPPDLRSRL